MSSFSCLRWIKSKQIPFTIQWAEKLKYILMVNPDEITRANKKSTTWGSKNKIWYWIIQETMAFKVSTLYEAGDDSTVYVCFEFSSK